MRPTQLMRAERVSARSVVVGYSDLASPDVFYVSLTSASAEREDRVVVFRAGPLAN